MQVIFNLGLLNPTSDAEKRPKVTLAAFVGGRLSRTLVREIIVKHDKGHSSGARMQS